MNEKLRKLCTAILLFAPCALATRTLDPDTWFMLNHGRYLLENSFTNIEPFTLHENFSFSFEKWLTCIGFYKIYDIFGSIGLYVFEVIATYIISILLYKLCKKVSNNWKVSLINTVLIMIPFTYVFSRTRPQMFSYIFLLAEVLLLEYYCDKSNWLYLIPIPILSCLYMQFHSTMWPMFFVMFMPYLFEVSFIKIKRIEVNKTNKLPIVICIITSILAGLINPYGIDSCIYLIKSLTGSFAIQISELNKTTIGSFVRLSMVVIPHFIYYVFSQKKLPLRYVFMIGGTFLMMMVAIRNQAFYLLFAGFISAYMYKDIEIEFKGVNALVVTTTVLTILGWCANGYYRLMMCDPYKSTYQKEIVDTLVENYDTQGKRIFTNFNTGDYCEYVGMKAYIDARAEVFIPEINNQEDILQEYYDLVNGLIHYQTLQDKYDFDYWLVYQNDILNTYLSVDKNYTCILEDDDFKIFTYNN